MTRSQLLVVAEALRDWAVAKGMCPSAHTVFLAKPGGVAIDLVEQFTGDPCVPGVDFLLWEPELPGTVSGYRRSVFNGKVVPEVRGGWFDFFCPVSVF